MVTAQDVREAAAGLVGVAVRTPLRFVEPLDAYLKLESLQPMGAFKLRGAYNAISRLPPAARRNGVITYSSGNHGQAVAYAAQRVGVAAVVVMPETAPPIKVAGVKRWGGEVVFAGRTSDATGSSASASTSSIVDTRWTVKSFLSSGVRSSLMFLAFCLGTIT